MATGIKTRQSTLLIKQKTEAEALQEELENKRHAHREKMAACKTKEKKLRKIQQQVIMMAIGTVINMFLNQVFFLK